MTTTNEQRPSQPTDDDNAENLFELFRPRPDDPPNIRYLRLAVISMGVILLAVFVAVIGRLIYLMTRPLPGAGAPSAIVSASPSNPSAALATAMALAADIQLQLPPGARIRGHTLAGNRMSVHYESAPGEGIMVIDLETGRPLSHVKILSTKN